MQETVSDAKEHSEANKIETHNRIGILKLAVTQGILLEMGLRNFLCVNRFSIFHYFFSNQISGIFPGRIALKFV
jgi:hypothetical protein